LTFKFDNNITDNTNYSGAGYTVTVFDTDRLGNDLSGQVRFRFENTYGGSINEIYLQDGAYVLPPPSIFGSSGVNFQSKKVNPGDLPGGNNLTPAFNASQGFNVDVVKNNADGIGLGEWLDLTFTLKAGVDYADIITAMKGPQPNADGNFMRFGIHVHNVAGGRSDSFINSRTPTGTEPPSVVPAPPSVILAGIGVLGLGGFARLRRRFAKTV
jgi:MYXO-CTERM domain-containing protein